MYDWCHEAIGIAMCRIVARGNARACWLRMRAAEVKEVFGARGEE